MSQPEVEKSLQKESQDTQMSPSPQNNNDVVMECDDQSKYLRLKQIFTTFLKNHTVYETIPENMKILVFNSELTIKDSIEAMIKEDIYCGLLWETNSSKFVGLFTIRDVLSLIKTAYTQSVNYLSKNPSMTLQNIIEEVFKKTDKENQMEIDDETNKGNLDSLIKNFGEFLKIFDNVTIHDYIAQYKSKDKKMISLSLDNNLEECISLIRKNNIHRIVVEDTKTSTVTGFITYEAIFEFFIENYYSEMIEFDITLNSIDLVSKNIIVMDKKESIYKCMETFFLKKISLIPIIDQENNCELFGYLYLKDIIYLFSGGEKFSFNDTVESFLLDLYDDIETQKPLGKDRIIEINGDIKMKEVFEMMSICPERKLIVRNDKDIGVITLTNIFSYLVD